MFFLNLQRRRNPPRRNPSRRTRTWASVSSTNSFSTQQNKKKIVFHSSAACERTIILFFLYVTIKRWRIDNNFFKQMHFCYFNKNPISHEQQQYIFKSPAAISSARRRITCHPRLMANKIDWRVKKREWLAFHIKGERGVRLDCSVVALVVAARVCWCQKTVFGVWASKAVVASPRRSVIVGSRGRTRGPLFSWRIFFSPRLGAVSSPQRGIYVYKKIIVSFFFIVVL